MLTLAVSTSSVRGSLCLGLNNNVLADISWQKETSHSEVVTQALEELMDTAKIRPKDLQRLICSHGPGSFTGIRVGLSVVRSLSYSYQLPILTLNDCLCRAINTPLTGHQLVVLDAQKNKIFAATYFNDKNVIREVLAPQLLPPQDLILHLPEDLYALTGEGLSYFPLLNEAVQKKIDRTAISNTFPDATSMYKYAEKNETQFVKQSWSELLPLYIRASAAEEIYAENMSRRS